MTYHNISKKMDKGKGIVIKMGSNEIEMNKMEGTGLFAGAGNQSGKISRVKKAGKWRDFSVDTANRALMSLNMDMKNIKKRLTQFNPN
jgi:hypothetical protein